ncbi:unnamed protein product [Cuscuta epithymum]|uniref:Uncharacterized protein n=2 Tax=Cuscuta epithymum TaxID=186058 RepID=A0AAV0DJ92_9ASTE|nr:unnamed protein product [Cuscuta epithymum]
MFLVLLMVCFYLSKNIYLIFFIIFIYILLNLCANLFLVVLNFPLLMESSWMMPQSTDVCVFSGISGAHPLMVSSYSLHVALPRSLLILMLIGLDVLTQKQPTVSRSSTEAEYQAIAYTVQDTLHIRSVLFELGFPVRVPTTLYCDNVSASYLSVNLVQHARSKHINIDYHFVRERVARGDLRIKYVPTQAQLADIFTKCLSPQRFTLLRDNMRIVSPAQLEGV